MTPAETLTAARLSPVGPYVPARVEWLEGWTGPVEVYIGPDTRWVRAALLDGFPVFMAHEGLPQRLDLRRPEVRDRLVRHGCPSWARDCAPAVWAWANGVEIADVFREPEGSRVGSRTYRRGYRLVIEVGDLYVSRHNYRPGWRVGKPVHERLFGDVDLCSGPETGAAGRACADLAALRAAGCVLEEADGWYVPLVGGGVGWWPKNLEATP